MKNGRILVLAVIAALLASPTGALACAACFGKSDSNMAKSVKSIGALVKIGAIRLHARAVLVPNTVVHFYHVHAVYFNALAPGR